MLGLPLRAALIPILSSCLLFTGCGDDDGGSSSTGTGASGTGANGTGGSGTGASGTGASGTGGSGTGASGTGGSGTGASGTGGGGGACTPDCGGKECGPDGCGDVCGLCDGGEACDPVAGTCETFCGNSCGAGCPACPSNSTQTLTCTASGLCKCNATCNPDCTGKSCGDDGCGGLCGVCQGDTVCTYDGGGAPAWTCQPFTGADPGMSFFVTSRGTGPAGGNLGGLAGADAICQQHAEEVGIVGKTWHAYLSSGAMAARDRIGAGPWVNAAGVSIVSGGCGAGCVDELHQNGIPAEQVLTERGGQVDWANAHDILTGSNGSGMPTGSDCQGWTSSSEFDSATVGHADSGSSWASSHDTKCDQTGMQCTAGQGNLYCFAL